MAQLKGTEKFVAESLQSYFSKTSNSVNFEEGDDPPDIYLKIDDKKIAVEITGLWTYYFNLDTFKFYVWNNVTTPHYIKEDVLTKEELKLALSRLPS